MVSVYTIRAKVICKMYQPNSNQSPKDSVQRQLIRGMNADEISLVMTANPIVQITIAERIQKQEKKAKKALNKALKEAKQLF